MYVAKLKEGACRISTKGGNVTFGGIAATFARIVCGARREARPAAGGTQQRSAASTTWRRRSGARRCAAWRERFDVLPMRAATCYMVAASISYCEGHKGTGHGTLGQRVQAV